MKKFILGAVLVSASATAFAHPAGCGLGTAVVFQNADEWHEHVLAATTNGTSGNQTFGMTSGTLGCESANGPLKNGIGLFIENNVEQLAADSAVGQGETLDALAELVGVSQTDDLVFKSAMKDNFDRIFTSAETTSGDVYDAIVAIMSENQSLTKYLG